MNKPLVSWRVWEIKDEKLLSIVNSSCWKSGKAYSSHVDAYYGINNIYQNGIHSWKTKEQAFDYFILWFTAYFNDSWCFGELYSWGKIIEHEFGYRSEFAYPKKLYAENQELAQKLQNFYGCEIEIYTPPKRINPELIKEREYLNECI